MGTDIRMIFQRKQPDGTYVEVDSYKGLPDMENRSYSYFGWLSGVRNYSAVKPMFPDRGLPKDWVGEGPSDHSHSWCLVDELIGVDYTQIIEDRCKYEDLGNFARSRIGELPEGEGKKMTLREFLGDWQIEQIHALKSMELIASFGVLIAERQTRFVRSKERYGK